MGGEASGAGELRRAGRERADRGADLVKIMTSGGVMTPTTDIRACQFTTEEVRAVVGEAHRLGLAVTAHALTAVKQCIAAGVDGIEHCSCLGEHGMHTPSRRSPRPGSWSARRWAMTSARGVGSHRPR